MSEIHAIILAAGGSVRMGARKMLLPYRGMTIIEKVIEIVLKSGIEGSLLLQDRERKRLQK